MVQSSSFVLFELDGQQCQMAWFAGDSKQDAPTPLGLASIAPVVARSDRGEWWIGQDAQRLRLSAPSSCILDLLTEESESRRESRWPFAPRRRLPDGSVAWELCGRLYPRSLIWSKLFLHARERAEKAGSEEIRSMALLVGRGVGPAQRHDLEQGAVMAGIDQLWWIDKIQALGYQLRHAQQSEEQRESTPSGAAVQPTQSEQSAPEKEDPLAKINALLGVQESSPAAATLSQVEFAPQPGSEAQSGDAPVQEAEQAPPEEHRAPMQGQAGGQEQGSIEAAPTPEAEESDDASEGEAASSFKGAEDKKGMDPDLEDTGSQQQDPRSCDATSEAAADEQGDCAAKDDTLPDVAPPQGSWLWMADGIALETAKLRFEPEFEVLDRQLIPGAQRLAWEDAMVRLLLEDLDTEEGVQIDGQSLAMVRIWDAAGKLMDKLASSAQAQLHLPHLVVHRNESLHFRQDWSRRRMDALVANAVAQLRQGWNARSEASEPQELVRPEGQESNGTSVAQESSPQALPWKWNRFGSLVEMPAWVRVGQQCDGLVRNNPRLEQSAALAGAALWVQERRRGKSRTLVNDHMVGDLLFESAQGDIQRCSSDGKTLPLREDLLLWQGEGEAQGTWTVHHCLGEGDERGESSRKIAQFEIAPSDKGKIQIRIEVQRQGKILISRSPSDRNAGAPELTLFDGGLSQVQIHGLRYQQDQKDVERFVGMRAMQMREQLARRCAGLQQALQERGAKMDDLLKTRLSEWLTQTQGILHMEASPEKNAPSAELNALTPAYEALESLVESLNGPQRKAYALHLEPLVALMEEPVAPENYTAVDPSWPLSLLHCAPPTNEESTGPEQVPMPEAPAGSEEGAQELGA